MNRAVTRLDGVDFSSQQHPYYLVSSVPPTTHAWYKLCALCSLLNHMGFESYIQSDKTTGHFWAPLLSAKVQAAHYLAGKKPLILNLGLVSRNSLGIGLQSHVWWDCAISQSQREQLDKLEHVYVQGDAFEGEYKRLHLQLPELPILNSAKVSKPRKKSLLYVHKYSGALTTAQQEFERIEVDFSAKLDVLVNQLHSASWLYMYEWSELAVLARWAGCPVVLIPNAQCLPVRSAFVNEWGVEGLAWGDSPDQLAFASDTVGKFEQVYKSTLGDWRTEILALVEDTQRWAELAEFDEVWPQSGVDRFAELFTEPEHQSARADRLKWARVHSQYDKWMQRSSLREIDAQIYAEHLMSGTLPGITVVIDHHDASLSQLADTVDSLSVVFGQPQQICIVSEHLAPEGFESTAKLLWLDRCMWQAVSNVCPIPTPWTLVVKAGTLLAPNSLIEWRLAARDYPLAKMIYADEDLQATDGSGAYPYFKPDANIELLRCTNYLGNAVLLKSADWRSSGAPLFDGRLYGTALRFLAIYGKAAFGHVDTVLYHSLPVLSAAAENAEFEVAKFELNESHAGADLTPLSRLGTWLLRYPEPSEARLSVVVSTGTQTGYLRSLLGSINRYQAKNVDDIVLVCQESQRPEVELVVTMLGTRHVQVVTLQQDIYNHGQALNAGVAQAKHEFILVADDDTELLEQDGLACMLGILCQKDVACVAPRLVTSLGGDPKNIGGPVILGVGGSASPYLGEAQGLTEAGVYSRLQLTQDVSAVVGSFFLMKRGDWKEAGGFDESSFSVFNTVLDFCLKLSETGRRHVWTPLTNVLHQGGKTIEWRQRDLQQKIALAEQEVLERKALHARWAKKLANDPYYNRHLSLIVPFDVEEDIVVDWQPKRHDRPRALALPMGSGAGQYRVVEPLNALQDAGLAQTSVVLPFGQGRIRLMQPLELVRAAPDRLILQHSVDDGQLSLIDGFRNAAPEINIIQTVDDLLGDVSDKHPNRQFQIREGHSRMKLALTKSDRLIVTTQPLSDQYKKYVPDVHVMPNTLGSAWMGLRKQPGVRKRLRVGWVGAGQHHGDLEMINSVVRELAGKVDWVFMGMCTDEVKPMLKEFHNFVSIADYPKKMSELDLDIAIAPLEDNPFNRCKSNLRLLEYGAMGWPVVCSDVYPYQADDPPVVRVRNSKTEWVDAIESLFEQKLRHDLGEALHQWVIGKYLLRDKTSEWFESIFK